MSTFKVGQKVRIKPREFKDGDYKFTYTDDMQKYAGKITEIVKIDEGYTYLRTEKFKVPDDNYRYFLKIDCENHYWSSGMLEAVNDDEQTEDEVTASKTIKGTIKEVITDDVPGYCPDLINYLGDEVTIIGVAHFDGELYYKVNENNLYWHESIINIEI